MERSKTCCFSGHEPGKHMRNGYFSNDEMKMDLRNRIDTEIKKTLEDGYTHFISGMGLGCDILFAQRVLVAREVLTQYDITLECVLPGVMHYYKWSKAEVKELMRILNQADTVTKISRGLPTQETLLKRNKYMVDKSSRLIAVYALYNEKAANSETRRTINMASDKSVQTQIIDVC